MTSKNFRVYYTTGRSERLTEGRTLVIGGVPKEQLDKRAVG